MKLEKVEIARFINSNAPNAVWPFKGDTQENWAYLNNIFTKEECKKIIEIGNINILADATILGKNESIRDSKIAWLYPTDDMVWIYRKVTDAVMALNEQYFKFDLFGLAEGFQFTKYDAPDGKYKAHIDKFFNGPVRKLSITIQLSDPEDYDGGELNLYTGSSPTVLPKEQGKLVAFPSYTLHEVMPVTNGTRYSLVAWVTGPPFK